MKILKTYSSEHIVNDREVKVIVENANSDNLLLLDNGEYIRPKSVISITDLEMVAFCFGAMLYKDCRTYENEYGNKVKLRAEDYEKIEYKPHPKYKAMQKMLTEKTKMISNRQQTEISEEVAKSERGQL